MVWVSDQRLVCEPDLQGRALQGLLPHPQGALLLPAATQADLRRRKGETGRIISVININCSLFCISAHFVLINFYSNQFNLCALRQLAEHYGGSMQNCVLEAI